MSAQKSKFRDFISKQDYIKALTIPEHIILWINVAASLVFLIIQLAVLKLYANWTTWIAFFASVISIFAVMAGAKQRVICPFLGIIASVFLITIAWYNHLYGSTIMYGFNIIMQVTSFIIWYKESKNKICIEPRHAKWWACLIYIAIFIGLTALFTWIEGISGFAKFWSGNDQAVPESLHIRIFDSAVLMFTVAGFLPMIKKYDQVWWVYIICDVSIAILWLLKGIENTDPDNAYQIWSTFTSGVCMTATCVIGIINWKRSLRRQEKKNRE